MRWEDNIIWLRRQLLFAIQALSNLILLKKSLCTRDGLLLFLRVIIQTCPSHAIVGWSEV